MTKKDAREPPLRRRAIWAGRTPARTAESTMFAHRCCRLRGVGEISRLGDHETRLQEICVPGSGLTRAPCSHSHLALERTSGTVNRSGRHRPNRLATQHGGGRNLAEFAQRHGAEMASPNATVRWSKHVTHVHRSCTHFVFFVLRYSMLCYADLPHMCARICEARPERSTYRHIRGVCGKARSEIHAQRWWSRTSECFHGAVRRAMPRQGFAGPRAHSPYRSPSKRRLYIEALRLPGVLSACHR